MRKISPFNIYSLAGTKSIFVRFSFFVNINQKNYPLKENKVDDKNIPEFITIILYDKVFDIAFISVSSINFTNFSTIYALILLATVYFIY